MFIRVINGRITRITEHIICKIMLVTMVICASQAIVSHHDIFFTDAKKELAGVGFRKLLIPLSSMLQFRHGASS